MSQENVVQRGDGLAVPFDVALGAAALFLGALQHPRREVAGPLVAGLGLPDVVGLDLAGARVERVEPGPR